MSDAANFKQKGSRGVLFYIYRYIWDNSVLVFKKKNTYKTRHAAYKLPTQGPLTDSHKSQTPELTKLDTRLQLAEDYLSESLLYNTEGEHNSLLRIELQNFRLAFAQVLTPT